MRPGKGSARRPDATALARYFDEAYVSDIRELQQEFSAVDPDDPHGLAAWLRRHPYLVDHEVAEVAGTGLRTVRRWKRRAELPAAQRRPPPGWRRPPPAAVVAPPDWRAGTWLEDRYRSGASIRQIAKAVRRSYRATRRLLRHRGVVFRPAKDAVASTHLCCTRGWLVENYVVPGLSLTRCARLAGVSRATMSDWLVHFGIRIRSAGEQLIINHAKQWAGVY
jgi:transposase